MVDSVASVSALALELLLVLLPPLLTQLGSVATVGMVLVAWLLWLLLVVQLMQQWAKAAHLVAPFFKAKWQKQTISKAGCKIAVVLPQLCLLCCSNRLV